METLMFVLVLNAIGFAMGLFVSAYAVGALDTMRARWLAIRLNLAGDGLILAVFTVELWTGRSPLISVMGLGWTWWAVARRLRVVGKVTRARRAMRGYLGTPPASG